MFTVLTSNFPLAATFGATLKFVVKDCDPSTGLPDSEEGYDDEYMLEDLEITVADQIQKNKKSNFTVSWDSAATDSKLLKQLIYFIPLLISPLSGLQIGSKLKTLMLYLLLIHCKRQ